MSKKHYTGSQIKELINGIDELTDEQKQEYSANLEGLTDKQLQQYAELFVHAKEKFQEVEEEYLPKLNELYKQKIAKIKEFVKKILPKFRKKHEKQEQKAEEKESEELLKQLEDI